MESGGEQLHGVGVKRKKIIRVIDSRKHAVQAVRYIGKRSVVILLQLGFEHPQIDPVRDEIDKLNQQGYDEEEKEKPVQQALKSPLEQ
ncbi:hypothetical protein D3C71_1501520 [compost metagenome]